MNENIQSQGIPELDPETKKLIIEASDKIALLNKNIDDIKKDMLTMLGIFTSLITFISVEIQILKVAEGPLILLGLSSLMIGGLLLFVMILINFIKDRNTWCELKKPLLVMPICFLILSGICFWYNGY